MKMKDIFSIKGKVIVITGGGNGIGHNLSLNMAYEGAFVYSIDIKFYKIIFLSSRKQRFHLVLYLKSYQLNDF